MPYSQIQAKKNKAKLRLKNVCIYKYKIIIIIIIIINASTKYGMRCVGREITILMKRRMVNQNELHTRICHS